VGGGKLHWVIDNDFGLSYNHRMNLPNLLTIIRILLIPALVNCLVYGYYVYGLLIFLLAGLTDSLDGIIARTSNQRTILGAYLDPMADKLLLNACFVTLAVLHLIPSWIAIIVVSRDFILIVGTLILHLTQTRFNIDPTWLGKSTTVVQLLYIILVLAWITFERDMAVLTPFLFLTAVITVLSGLHYIMRGIRLVNTYSEP
jgi:cardiolipin synthase